MLKTLFVATCLLLANNLTAASQQPKLTFLPKNVTSGQMKAGPSGMVPSGREQNLGGWMVLNGARFRNAEFPELAKILGENYKATNGYVSPDPDFTQLTADAFELAPNGDVVRGVAICPTRTICGDLVGMLAPFNLNSSL